MSQNDESLGALGAPSANQQGRVEAAVGGVRRGDGGTIRSTRTIYSVCNALRM